MSTGTIDYKYSLDLIGRINKAVESDNILAQIFTEDGFNFWERFQGVLWSDSKIWSVDRRLQDQNNSLILSFKIFATGLILLFISLAGALFAAFTKKKVLVFTEDKVEGNWRNDTRLNDLYEALDLENTPYFEVVHTIPNSETFKKFGKRNRPVVYLESVDFVFSPLFWWKRGEIETFIAKADLSAFEGEEKKFVEAELKKMIFSIRVCKAKINFLKLLIGLCRAEVLFSIDDTRHYSEFCQVGKSLGLPTYGIQHGHFTKYHTGWLKMTNLPGEVMRPSKLLVWSNYWKEELIRLGTYFKVDEIEVGGSRFSQKPEILAEREKTAILIPYEKDAPKHEVKDFIDKVLACGKFEVIFKIREGQDEKNIQLEEYGLSPQQVTVVRSVKDVFNRVGVVAGTYSTFLYDCVRDGIPTAIIETSLDYGEGMVRNGLAEFIKKGEDICAQIDRLFQTSKEELEDRREKLIGTNTPELKETLRSIIKQYASN
jgi:hypothetical protein